jgi:hypothetical protein
LEIQNGRGPFNKFIRWNQERTMSVETNMKKCWKISRDPDFLKDRENTFKKSSK